MKKKEQIKRLCEACPEDKDKCGEYADDCLLLAKEDYPKN